MEKDLQYYLDHPDELPDDPAVLAQLAEGMNNPVISEDEPKPAEKDVKPTDAPSSVEDKKDVEEGKKQEEEGDILMPSGKGTIPYAVLKTEREKRQAAEGIAAELSQKLEDIQAQLAKGTDKGDAKAADLSEQALATMSPEELDALRADFPVFGKVVDTLLGTIGSLSKEVESLKQTEQTRATETRQEVAKTVQELIDNEPILLHLQTNDPAMFEKAIEVDAALRGDPRYPDAASRFKRVAEVMEFTFGPFDGVSKPKPPVDKELARETVTKKLEATKTTPRSLSDVPTGDLPASDEMNELSNMSAVEISDRLMKMSPDQRTAFLNRI